MHNKVMQIWAASFFKIKNVLVGTGNLKKKTTTNVQVETQ